MRSAQREQRRGSEARDGDEREPAVAWELEGETGEWRADEDGCDRDAVHEGDGCRGCVRPRTLCCGENGRERKAGGEGDHERSVADKPKGCPRRGSSDFGVRLQPDPFLGFDATTQ